MHAEGVGALAMRSMIDDANSLCLVKECMALASRIFLWVLANLKTIKEKINELDVVQRLGRYRVKAPLVAGTPSTRLVPSESYVSFTES